MNSAKPNKGGRPRSEDLIALPLEELDHLLVHGIVSIDDEGRTCRSYPTPNALAKRYGVSWDRIKKYSDDHRCEERRQEQIEIQANDSDEAHDEELKTQMAEAQRQLLMSKVRLAGVMSEMLEAFIRALMQGKVNMTKPSDFVRLAQLYLKVIDDVGGSEGEDGTLTLEDLQESHAEMLERLRESQRHAPKTEGLGHFDDEEE